MASSTRAKLLTKILFQFVLNGFGRTGNCTCTYAYTHTHTGSPRFPSLVSSHSLRCTFSFHLLLIIRVFTLQNHNRAVRSVIPQRNVARTTCVFARTPLETRGKRRSWSVESVMTSLLIEFSPRPAITGDEKEKKNISVGTRLILSFCHF